jgi:hypothetical protein
MRVRIIGSNADASLGDEPTLAALDLGNGLAVLMTTSPVRTMTLVAGSITSVVLLAANDARLAATVLNEDKASNLYVDEGPSPANPSGRRAVVPPAATYEVGFGFKAVLNGFWDGAPTGSARVTEFA